MLLQILTKYAIVCSIKERRKIMDSKKILKKKVGPPISIKILTVIMALLCVLFLAVTITGFTDDEEVTEGFTQASETDEMAYLDVVAVSDWLLKTDVDQWHEALTMDGDCYIVVLDKDTFTKMEYQNETYEYIWEVIYSEGEDAAIPEDYEFKSYRLEGQVTKINSEIRNDLSDVFDIDKTELDDTYGTVLLDTTRSSADSLAIGGLVLTILFAILTAVMVSTYLKTSKAFKACYARLEELNLVDEAVAQLSYEDNTVYGKKLTVSRSFIYSKASGIVAPIADIRGLYTTVTKLYGIISTQSALTVTTEYVKPTIIFLASGKDKKGSISSIIARVRESNPDIDAR